MSDWNQGGRTAEGRGARGLGPPDLDRNPIADEQRAFGDRAAWSGEAEERRARHREAAYVRAYGQAAPGSHRGRGPKGYARSDRRIYEDVCDALTEDAELDASQIEVAVRDGEVSLDGAVPRREDRRRAEALAERTPGVRDVMNHLRVGWA